MALTVYTKVWPLKEGLMGVNDALSPVELKPFQRGRMEFEEAKRQAAAGNLQLMAGVATKDLKPPPPPRPTGYSTKVSTPDAPEDLDSVPDEEPPPPEPPKARPRRRVTAKKRYARRDMQAEKN